MKKSDDIKDLAQALCKAQSEMKPAQKSATNPFFKSRYADLSDIWEVCKEPLARNGLALLQVPGFEEGQSTIETMLVHSSGQWISGVCLVKPLKTDPQSMGSAITYMRRYSLAALVGVVTDDDDGDAASTRENATQGKGGALTGVSRPTTASQADWERKFASDKQITAIHAMSKKAGFKPEEMKDKILMNFGKHSSKDLSQKEASHLINELKASLDEGSAQ